MAAPVPAKVQAQAQRRPATKPNALFIDPMQRRTLEAVRQCRAPVVHSPADDPSAEPPHTPAAFAAPNAVPPAVLPAAMSAAAQERPGRSVSVDEDMDVSDCESAVRAPSGRYMSPASTSTRDATPALSFISSDAETESMLADDSSDWQQSSSSAFIRSPSVSSEAVCVPVPEKVPLFFKTEEASPEAPTFGSWHVPELWAQDAPPTPSTDLQYPSDDTDAIRRFLDGLRRPVGHRYAAFFGAGIRTQEDVRALAALPHEWDTVRDELLRRGVTLMEWLCVKAGLERVRETCGLDRPEG
ncbi:hypothetical protein PsYK624_056720 [Phanerochaete sordida]|uniref:Uncharacterized protein n=1 Tax=Phanerochaete sordida TaxID=48140 RepID=A0A9P3G8Y3_9APHY|nr:hypothetical protein PsYK624_056720 [Phanerochaete sordida]